jgi:aspartate aminotransferase-like enzyme
MLSSKWLRKQRTDYAEMRRYRAENRAVAMTFGSASRARSTTRIGEMGDAGVDVMTRSRQKINAASTTELAR